MQRRDGSAHLDGLSETVVELLRTHHDAARCLTGKAQSIAAIRRGLD